MLGFRQQMKAKKEKTDTKFSGMYYNFEIFHMREKAVPVDSVEIKDNVHAFAWEPVGSKFAVIHGEIPNVSVSFYEVKSGQTPALLKKLDRKQINHLFWAPTGQFIVLAGLRSMNGYLEFVDTSDFTVMNVSEHLMATDIEWDPTGRYVVSGVTWWTHKVDNSFWLWSFQGRLLKQFPMDRFCQLMWRPRPASLLTQQQVKDIKKNLKKYSIHFEIKDRMRLSKASKEQLERRRKLMSDFEEYRKKRVADFISLRKKRLQLRQNVDTDDLSSDTANMEEEKIEFFIKTEETVEE